MNVLRATGMAFALYSRIPMPPLDWESGARRYTLYAFPLVGLAVGGGLLLWTWLAGALGLGQPLWAAGMTAIPLLITGGIHLDGFCDVCDALASHQSRERKLEIMADPHVGAFAVQGCGLLLLLTFGLWCQAERTDGTLWAALLLVPALSRGLSAFAALTLPNARGGGLLAAVTGAGRRGRWLPLCAALLCAAGLAALEPGYLWIGGGPCWPCGTM